MKIIHILVILLYVISLISGCNRLKNNDQKKINDLNELPVLWKSSILVANPSIPDMTVLFPMYDSYDANLIEHMTDTAEKTPDYIPEEVRAFAVDEYNNKPTTITIRIGDIVSVIQETINNSNRSVFLVRTESNTYTWLYSYHIEDENGERISSL